MIIKGTASRKMSTGVAISTHATAVSLAYGRHESGDIERDTSFVCFKPVE
jgi:hypothetical protein